MADFAKLTDAEERALKRLTRFRGRQIFFMLRLLRTRAVITLADAMLPSLKGDAREIVEMQAEITRRKADALAERPKLSGAMRFASYRMLQGLKELNVNGGS